MMFVMAEKEDTSPGPKEPESPRECKGLKELHVPKDHQELGRLQSPRGRQDLARVKSPRDRNNHKEQQNPRDSTGLGGLQSSKKSKSHTELHSLIDRKGPRGLQSPRKSNSHKELRSPRNLLQAFTDYQSPRELQSPQDFHTPTDHDTPINHDGITLSPSFQTPKADISDQPKTFFNDDKNKKNDGTLGEAGAGVATNATPAPPEDSELDVDDDASEISFEEDIADGDTTKLGGGDADTDLVDSLLQEEDDDLDSPTCREYKNGEGEEEAVSIEMKMRKKKALLEFRCKVEDAILGNYLLRVPSESDDPIGVVQAKEKLRNTTLWGIPLLPSKSHVGSDTVLLKFLKAREYKVEEAYEMLRKTVIWRKELNVEDIMEEELESEDLLQVAYANSVDKKGHPLCYNLFGPFRDREMYSRVFGTEEKRKQYMRWRVQCMEAAIRKLSFKPRTVDSIVLISDLGNSPGPAMKELRTLCKHLINLFEDYYPEFVYRNLVINVPFWYYVSHSVHSKFAGQKAKKGFIFARPNKSAETLVKYINAENLPIQHGGLQRRDDEDFTGDDKASQLVVKANSVGTIEVPVSEGGNTLQWDVTIVGWEVSYKEEFVPLDEGSYKVLIQKEKKVGECARNFYHVREPGNIVFSFQNSTSKKKKVFYRTKCFPTPVLVPVAAN